MLPGKGWAACLARLPTAALDGVEHRHETIRGRPVTLVRHDYANWRRLRDTGLVVPTPLAHYDFPARFRPMRHQLHTAAFLVENMRAFVLNDIGSGKTLSAIWAADYLIRQRQIRRVLVIAPLSTCVRAWIPELFGALPATRAVNPRGRKNMVAAFKDARETWVVINPENVPLAVEHAANFDLVIVDEFTKFKNVATQRWRALVRLVQDKWLWLMSGTPNPQSPEDALGPIRLAHPGIRMSKRHWRDLVCYPAGPYRWLPKADAEQTIARYMQPAIRYSREQCVDLPDKQFVDLECTLTKQQIGALKEIEASAVATMESGEKITAANAAAILSKSLQIMAGGVYGFDASGDRITHTLDAAPFFDAVADTIEQASCPVLVFTSFRSSAKAIHADLEKRGLQVRLLTGGVSSGQRMAMFQAVQDGELDALVAVPGTMAHGITLTRSHVVIWATPPFSAEEYTQAIGRIERIGQKNAMTIYHVVQNSLAKDLFRRLTDKKLLQDAVLDIIQRGMT